VNGRQSEQIAKHRLRHREIEGVILNAVHDRQAQGELADQVRQVARGVSLAHSGYPGPLDRAVDRGGQPKQPRQMWVRPCYFQELRMLDEPDGANSKGDYAVVHYREQEAVQIHEVAGHMDGGELP
jgi:hypothetical protein